jgi:hypothetical protein
MSILFFMIIDIILYTITRHFNITKLLSHLYKYILRRWKKFVVRYDCRTADFWEKFSYMGLHIIFIGCAVLYVGTYNIFVYTIDGVEVCSSHKNRYIFSPAYPRAMDGGAPWVFIWYICGTPHAKLYNGIPYTSVIIYSMIPHTNRRGTNAHRRRSIIYYNSVRLLTVLGTHPPRRAYNHHTDNCHYPSPRHSQLPAHVH